MKLEIKYLIILLLSVSCVNSNTYTKKQYFEYVNNPKNGFKKNIGSTNLNVAFLFTPKEYISLNSTVKAIDKYDSVLLFNVYIKPTIGKIDPINMNVTNLNDYTSLLNYLNNNGQEQFSALINDSIDADLVQYYFENTFNIKPESTYVLGFRNVPNIKTLTIIYDDKAFDLGRLKVKFNISKLLNKKFKIV